MGYRDKQVLDAFDLDLPLGRTTSVLGPGGSGKTTLLRALAGEAQRPRSMWVRGQLGRRPDAVTMTAQKCGLENTVGALAEAVSGTSGNVLMLDEPFVDLAPEEQAELHHQLEDIRGRCTVLCVTHHLKHARRLSDHVVLLVDGSVVESAPVAQFFEQPQATRTADFLATGS